MAVSRLVQCKDLTDHIQAQIGSFNVSSQPLGEQASRRLGLQVGSTGKIESLRFEDDPLSDTQLRDHEVDIKVAACGITINNLASVLSKTEESPLRCETSGVVTRAGASSKFKLSDLVFRLTVSSAKNPILLSRRSPIDDSAKDLVKELRSVCNNMATPVCNVTDEEALKKVVSKLSTSLPPIKGCIQGSMVLKVLSDKPDFFVFLSSTVSITGGPEQANYAAGSTFQDTFTRYLASQGANVVSIDLPIIKGIGYVAEKLFDYLRSSGVTYITEDELRAVLDYHCRPETAAQGYQTQSWGEDPLFSHLELGQADTGVVGERTETDKAVTHRRFSPEHLLWRKLRRLFLMPCFCAVLLLAFPARFTNKAC
ncbi:hypothetical protein CGLO_00063 [Colletotrichum gloeosporioides Cg-14]|uniref:Ketoreductase domain-containing protein n=1 Tax=Colletotrichum gloeosporioides (strain Cg-14) TaxID=1237896 RepID=T0M856_COLGC|nr:hypothetical protein CGLO_00063 [Colletotrichum gloeosporioides Cg-14]